MYEHPRSGIFSPLLIPTCGSTSWREVQQVSRISWRMGRTPPRQTLRSRHPSREPFNAPKRNRVPGGGSRLVHPDGPIAMDTRPLEAALGYSFRQPEHLVPALTHPSLAHGPVRGRPSTTIKVGFLGDAVPPDRGHGGAVPEVSAYGEDP